MHRVGNHPDMASRYKAMYRAAVFAQEKRDARSNEA
jgi:hypothetical protein